MSAKEYVQTYLHLQVWKDEMFTTILPVQNYLISGKNAKAAKAAVEYAKLISGVAKLAGQPGKPLPKVFEVQKEKYVTTSLWRVYNGKGAPNEIQDALWLALLCGLVKESTLFSYIDTNLGMDCGGFVANYFGIGRPSPTDPDAEGATGYSPRTIWGRNPNQRRKAAGEIQVDDAAIFFEDVRNDDPNIMAQKGSDGAYNRNTGSQASHIAVVTGINVIAATGQVNLEIAESSGAKAAVSAGNGVNVRSLNGVKATVAKGLVYVMSGDHRVYFVGPKETPNPYMPTFLFG